MVTAFIERFEACLEELAPLLPGHYEELALYKDHIPLDPNFPAYVAREQAGGLIFCTIRKEGELVGYYIGFLENAVFPNLHYKTTPMCKTDIFYICPEYRMSGAGRLLFATVEAELKRRGVVVWFVGSKVHLPADGLFEMLGFDRVETYFSKLLVT